MTLPFPSANASNMFLWWNENTMYHTQHMGLYFKSTYIKTWRQPWSIYLYMKYTYIILYSWNYDWFFSRVLLSKRRSTCANKKSHCQGHRPRDCTHCSPVSEYIVKTKPDRPVLFSIIDNICNFTSRISVFCSYKVNMGSKREPFRVLLPLLNHTVPVRGRNCYLTSMAVVLWAREPLLGTTNIGAFKRGKIFLSRWNMFTINMQTSLKVMHFYITGPPNILEMMPVIGMELWCPPSLHSRLLDGGHI